MAMLVFTFVNFSVYPTILKYQAGTQAGNYLSRADGADSTGPTAYLLQEAPVDYSFEFDCPRPVQRLTMDSLARTLTPSGKVLVFAPGSFADSLTRHGLHTTALASFPNFHISQLTREFVNYRTRASVLTPWSLFIVRRQPFAP
jgi:hypothetical protein